MKYKVLEKRSINHDGINIVVKLLEIKGKAETRFFIYDEHHLPTCGGAGWKDVNKMLSYYDWWKRQPSAIV